jgi:hypothetical protein
MLSPTQPNPIPFNPASSVSTTSFPSCCGYNNYYVLSHHEYEMKVIPYAI